MQVKFDEEKAQLHQRKEKLLTEKLEFKERVKRALCVVTLVEVQTKEQVP
jgi:hypothetical protein